MATSKKIVAKKASKKAAPSKKAVQAAKKTAPVKKQVKPAAKKSVVKKAAPQKVTAKKTAPVKATKKEEVAKNKTMNTKATKTSTKTTAKKSAPIKKATPQKKTAPVKKEVVEKKAVKKVIAPKKAEKTIAAKPVKKAAAPAPKKIIKTAPAPAAPARPSMSNISRAAVREEKKTNIIVAHRKLENKSKKEPSKTMERYQPETRSILDEPVQETGPVFRYSDEELNEFKELILGRLEAARKELAYLQGLITRKDEAGTEDTENRYMNMEDGSGAMEREQLAQLASRQIQFISHLEKAMMRIENKTYGICRVTGKLIDKARLRAVPHATLSIEAKNTMNK